MCNGESECDDNSDEDICSKAVTYFLEKQHAYCKNNGEILVSSSGLPSCKCEENFSGKRCTKALITTADISSTTVDVSSPTTISDDASSPTAETEKLDSSKTDSQGGWIAGTVIGILLLVAVVVVVVIEYRKRRKRALVQSSSPQSIENPVYGLPLSDMSHEEIVDLQKPSTSSDITHSIVNPLYENVSDA